MMYWKGFGAGLCAAVIAVMGVASQPAEAAAKKKRVVTRNTVVLTGRAPTRVTVRRSFLDAGTEVAPGERKFMDYAIPPGYSPMSVLDNSSRFHQSPLPGPFDLPGRNNPWPYNW